jgi:hypothetical protein
MALNFPSTPNVNATYTFNDKTWTYTGDAWALVSTSLTTTAVSEGSNLYFTNARVYSNVTQLGYITSSALSGYATNLQLSSYATTSNLALKANIADLTTANISELSNLYFTNARVYSNVTQLGYITSASLSGYATNTQLDSYATTANLALKANIADLNTSNVTEGSGLYFTNARAISAVVNTTLSNITVSGNVVAGNISATYSRLGTVQSGSWNGSNISTTYTDAKIVSVSNTAPITASTSAGAVTIGMANSGVTATTYGSGSTIPVFTVDQYGRITSVTDTAVAASATGGFTVSTITTFPGHSGNIDYGDLVTITADAFGVSLGTSYDCMEPVGSIVSEDLAVL